MASSGKAVVIVEKGKVEIKDLPLPKLSPGFVLAKVLAVGLNPTDWKSIDNIDAERVGSRSGCDFVGEVIQLGPGLTKDVKKGDRIAGFVFGASAETPDNAAFGEYVAAKEHAFLTVPDSVSNEEAATLGVSVTTVVRHLPRLLCDLPLAR
ncbi:hypothetical protein ONZ43_g4698 [Nemania bipapillata]|uniref:Uncharacterized protein n=1 Tax=Nemania bipapillata TaxID=110536 RepID=A0ACC2IJD3_9PEZI|nr:hypothetical protein ONZ43_g4698 [Nemania bipapillata]